MIRFIVGCTLMMVAACSKPGAAETYDGIMVALAPADATLVVEWRLPDPVTVFVFSDEDMPTSQRLSDWLPEGDMWEFDGMSLSRTDGAAFDSFTLNLKPISEMHRRKYVPVARIGTGGWVLLSGAFAPQGLAHRFSFEGFPEDAIVYGDGEITKSDMPREGEGLGIFYVGPPANVSDKGGILIAGPEIPENLRADMSASLAEALSKLTKAWGYAPQVPPAVIITSDEGWKRQSWKGGVSAEVITFHVRGYDLDDISDAFRENIRNVSLHEAIHLWNTSLFESLENAEQSWVQEGGSEYIANRLWMSREAFNAAVQKSLNGCILELGTASIRQTEIASRGQTPYLCGHVVHLAAELAAVKAGNSSVLGIWKDVFDAADETRTYDSAAFTAAAEANGGQEFAAVMALFDEGLTYDNRVHLLERLNALGADIVPLGAEQKALADTPLSTIVLKNLLRGYCNGGYSFRRQPDSYKLETEDRCGQALAGNPEITTLNGRNLVEAPLAVYFAALEACTEKQPIILTRTDGESLAPLECPEPLAALPELYEVRSAGRLPDL